MKYIARKLFPKKEGEWSWRIFICMGLISCLIPIPLESIYLSAKVIAFVVPATILVIAYLSWHCAFTTEEPTGEIIVG